MEGHEGSLIPEKFDVIDPERIEKMRARVKYVSVDVLSFRYFTNRSRSVLIGK